MRGLRGRAAGGRAEDSSCSDLDELDEGTMGFLGFVRVLGCLVGIRMDAGGRSACGVKISEGLYCFAK